jgi:gamma-glutamyltranspeptidase / glutathione hydrolase
MRYLWRRSQLISVITALVLSVGQPTWVGATMPIVPLDRGNQGMVVSAHPLASAVGLAILQQGGNAVDAAVATALAISVVEPFSAGIGGGGFLLFYQAQQNRVEALDFRERAPLKATPTMYLDAQGNVRRGASINGYESVAVPGTIAGLSEVQRKYGKLPWKTVVAPAIQLAASGFPVSWRFVEMSKLRAKVLQQNRDARAIFTHNGKLYAPGDRLVQADLAKTLRSLAENPQNFYTGAIATAIAQDMAANGGLITKQDLQQYRPIWRQPVCGQFRQAQVCSMPPPSSGGVHLLQMLNMISDTDLKSLGWHHPDALHLMAEAMKIAYADRAQHLGDPDFVKVPVAALINPAYAKLRRQAINPQKATPSTQVKPAEPTLLDRFQRSAHSPVFPAPVSYSTTRESPDTSHLTVVDRDRNAVSLTFTINLSFGSGMVAKGTGIVLNNEMDDFAIAPDTPNAFGLVGREANAIAPRKTPLSSMTPTIVTEQGRLRLVMGAPGGSTIITTALQVALNVLVYDMDARRAISAARLHHQWLPDQLRVERWGFDALTLADLRRRGHIVTERLDWGNGNVIVVLPDGTLDGAADPRGEGAAYGF